MRLGHRGNIQRRGKKGGKSGNTKMKDDALRKEKKVKGKGRVRKIRTNLIACATGMCGENPNGTDLQPYGEKILSKVERVNRRSHSPHRDQITSSSPRDEHALHTKTRGTMEVGLCRYVFSVWRGDPLKEPIGVVVYDLQYIYINIYFEVYICFVSPEAMGLCRRGASLSLLKTSFWVRHRKVRSLRKHNGTPVP